MTRVIGFTVRLLIFGLLAVGMESVSNKVADTSDKNSGSDPAIETDLLAPYDRLVTIEVAGQRIEVPEKNHLLRCFQYLSMNTISYGDFCWNGECTNCQVWYHLAGQTEAQDRPALACRMEVIEGMVVTTMSRFIKLDGIPK